MPRNLDLTALRSFVAVADCGGVTRAAAQLNLTQSAVSMQIKRLEEALDQPLLTRAGRGVDLTPQGEQLLSYGRRLLSLNDEVWGRMTEQEFEGEVSLGVPHDIVYPHIPQVMQMFAAEFPRVRVRLISSYTRALKDEFAAGRVDLILTTEAGLDAGGETLQGARLIWVGAEGGQAWQERPLPLAFENACAFRQPVQEALDGMDISWVMAVTSDSTRTVEASVSADLAVHATLEGGAGSKMLVPVRHGGALPELPEFLINMYVTRGENRALAARLAQGIRNAYRPAVAQAAE
ncbi:LysR family transcriptional regulator [Oceanomicrobium pacificus]|uniref:LysR family transcriptional regulator n=1 Tax=Oceanomicrobium pacificus TaxID=2692916 RepID=A0A6B0TY39_9RHOB|nr:LysR family transcriptional regulator [Oceanomicrobium pacificus]MXU63831.1 LysR family transcriptional regulator [Oceanomicrobium pacificus]